MPKPEIYVSVDIETDGGVAGINNMLSFGAVAYKDGEQLDTFYAKVVPRPEFKPDPQTMEWWGKQSKEAWKEATSNAEPAEIVIPKFRLWLEALPGQPVFVGTPAAWDFSFIYYYLNRFAGESPFKHRALDIRSYAMAATNSTFTGSDKSKKIWDSFRTYKNPMEHNALEDAKEQGAAFINLMKYVKDNFNG